MLRVSQAGGHVPAPVLSDGCVTALQVCPIGYDGCLGVIWGRCLIVLFWELL